MASLSRERDGKLRKKLTFFFFFLGRYLEEVRTPRRRDTVLPGSDATISVHHEGEEGSKKNLERNGRTENIRSAHWLAGIKTEEREVDIHGREPHFMDGRTLGRGNGMAAFRAL